MSNAECGYEEVSQSINGFNFVFCLGFYKLYVYDSYYKSIHPNLEFAVKS